MTDQLLCHITYYGISVIMTYQSLWHMSYHDISVIMTYQLLQRRSRGGAGAAVGPQRTYNDMGNTAFRFLQWQSHGGAVAAVGPGCEGVEPRVDRDGAGHRRDGAPELAEGVDMARIAYIDGTRHHLVHIVPQLGPHRAATRSTSCHDADHVGPHRRGMQGPHLVRTGTNL